MAEKEYIERDAVIELIRSYRCSTDVAFHMEEALNEIPAADVRPVASGKWKKVPCHETDEAYTYICPFCRWCMIAIEPMNFCPNCGADMREV